MLKLLQLLTELKWWPWATSSPSVGLTNDLYRLSSSGLFDPEYYSAANRDIEEADAARHFLEHGLAEGRNPCAFFDVSYYLATNPDVAEAGANPVWHFADHGWREFRLPSPRFDSRRYFLLHLAGTGQATNPLKHFMWHGRAAGLVAPALSGTTASELRRMSAAAKAALDPNETDPPNPELLGLVARACIVSGLIGMAQSALGRLILCQPDAADNHADLAELYARQKRWWLVELSMNRAIELSASWGGDRSDWLKTLAKAQNQMSHYSAAEATIRKALARKPDSAEWHYHLGLALERQGKSSQALDSYARATQLSDDSDVRAHGVGAFHEAHGNWEEAREAYKARLKVTPTDSELHNRLGQVHDRLFEWNSAESCYEKALTFVDPVAHPKWHFQLGAVRERMGRYAEAADAYQDAIHYTHSPKGYWFYRLGYSLTLCDQASQACAAFQRIEGALQASLKHPRSDRDSRDELKQALLRDTTKSDVHYALGEARESVGDLDGAIDAYRAAVARSEEHRPLWYYRLGNALALVGCYDKACWAFAQTHSLQRIYDQPVDWILQDEALSTQTLYLEYRECLPLREDLILYESFAGRSLSCNPLAVFRALIDDPDYRNFHHVWTLNDKGRIPDDLRARRNVVFVAKNSDGYLRALASAKFLINNNGFEPFFIRRPGQRYLETWHGTPLKTLGKDQNYKFFDHKHTQRNFLQASHLIAPNEHTAKVLVDSYDLGPLATAALAHTGYPRVDMTLGIKEDRKRELIEQLGLNPELPVVLYAPTWRGTPDDVHFDSERLRRDLMILAQRKIQLLFRGHNYLEGMIEDESLDCILAPASTDTNELLAIVDVLITDYSSVLFDFVNLKRPIIYYVYDLEEYERDRGLYFAIDDMPGTVCHDIEAVCAALDSAVSDSAGNCASYQTARETFCANDDGKSTQRVIDFFFCDSSDFAVDYCDRTRNSVVFSAGAFGPNGITASFINLLRAIDLEKHSVIVGFTPETVEASPLNLEQFRELPEGICAVARHGLTAMTLDEQRVWSLIESGAALNSTTTAIRNRIYDREFARIFGSKIVHISISFAGYDPFWTGILIANDQALRKVVYLHNDMQAEREARFPELAQTFELYRLADTLISVSAATDEINRLKLAGPYALPESRFDICENVIDPKLIRLNALGDLQSLDHNEVFASGGPVFISIGRLSVEKDHTKLIQSFAPIAAQNPKARLIILGTGPLESALRDQIDELSLGAAIHLLGHIHNPYPYIRRADCFVLSSNHEGQGLVLLEAMVLGKPIIATDIKGVQSVLSDGRGHLVPNTVAGLTDGMRTFLRREILAADFDAAAYRRDSVRKFHQNVLNSS